MVNNSRFGGQAWHIELVYAAGDIVSDKGAVYVCIQDTEGGQITDKTIWALADETTSFDATVGYAIGDSVVAAGVIYTAIVDNPITPPPSSEWEVDPIVEFGGKKYTDIYNYTVGDIVSEQGMVQVCINDTIGPFDQSNWFRLIKPEIGGRNWITDTEYKKEDIIGYGDEAYICLNHHTSVSGASPDGNPIQVGQVNWKHTHPEPTVGITWKDNTEYDLGDIVTYNDNIFIATTHHRSDELTDTNGNPEKPLQIMWSSKAELGGVLWRAGLNYQRGDTVTKRGHLYFCSTPHLSTNLDNVNGHPTQLNQTVWTQVLITEYAGKNWLSSHRYEVGDVVSFSGNIYISKTYSNLGQNPVGSIANWHDISTQLVYKGEFTPILGTEYPVEEIHTYYRVAGLGLGNTYTFTSGDLDTETVKDGDELIHVAVWTIKPGVLVPTEIGGRSYSNAERYLVGDMVTYNGVIHTCITDVINLEAFNPSKWQAPEIGILSDETQANNAGKITNIIQITQTDYDNITLPQPTTLYIITQ